MYKTYFPSTKKKYCSAHNRCDYFRDYIQNWIFPNDRIFYFYFNYFFSTVLIILYQSIENSWNILSHEEQTLFYRNKLFLCFQKTFHNYFYNYNIFYILHFFPEYLSYRPYIYLWIMVYTFRNLLLYLVTLLQKNIHITKYKNIFLHFAISLYKASKKLQTGKFK